MQASPKSQPLKSWTEHVPLFLHHELDKLVVCIIIVSASRSQAVKRRGQPTVDSAVTILIGLTDHLIDFIVGELLTDRGHDMAQFGGRDEAIVVAVKNLCVWSAFQDASRQGDASGINERQMPL